MASCPFLFSYFLVRCLSRNVRTIRYIKQCIFHAGDGPKGMYLKCLTGEMEAIKIAVEIKVDRDAKQIVRFQNRLLPPCQRLDPLPQRTKLLLETGGGTQKRVPYQANPKIGLGQDADEKRQHRRADCERQFFLPV